MYQRIVIFILLLTAGREGFPQEVRDFAWYDRQTYRAWEAQDWPRLTELGREALAAGYDYFYLHQRLGIAFFAQGYYRLAVRHFARALAYNTDPVTVEYLYYAYALGGRAADAALHFGRYRELLKKRGVNPPSCLAAGLYSEGGLKLISPEDPGAGALKYFHLGLQQQLGGRVSLYHGYVRVSQNLFSYDTRPGMGPGRPPVQVKNTFRYAQNEYYLRAGVALAPGWQVIGTYRYQEVADSLSFGNRAFQAGISKNLDRLDLSLLYGQALIHNRNGQAATYRQVSGTLTLYPLGSDRLYSQTTLTWAGEAAGSRLLLYQKAGLRIAPGQWLEGYGYFGNVQNVQDMEGFYLYNLPDPMELRLGLTWITLAGTRLKLLAGYTFEQLTAAGSGERYYQHYLFAGIQVRIKRL